MWRPNRNIRVSANSIAAIAPPKASHGLSEPVALAPPPIRSARAAGTGSPMASRNTTAIRIE